MNRIFLLIAFLICSGAAPAARKPPCRASTGELAVSEATASFDNLLRHLHAKQAFAPGDLADLVARQPLENPARFASRWKANALHPFAEALARWMRSPEFDDAHAAATIRRLIAEGESDHVKREGARDATRNLAIPVRLADLPADLPASYSWMPTVIHENGDPVALLMLDGPDNVVATHDLRTGQTRRSLPQTWPVTHLESYRNPAGETVILLTQGGLRAMKPSQNALVDATEAEIPPAVRQAKNESRHYTFLLGGGATAAAIIDSPHGQPRRLLWYDVAQGAGAKVYAVPLAEGHDVNTTFAASQNTPKPWLAYLSGHPAQLVILDARGEKEHWRCDVANPMSSTPVFFHADGELRIALKTKDGIRIVDPLGKKDWGLIAHPSVHDEDLVVVNRNGDTFALMPSEGRIDIYDLKTRQPTREIRTGLRQGITPGTFSFGDQTFVYWENGNNEIVLADFETRATLSRGPVKASFRPVATYEYDGQLHGLVVDDTGRPPVKVQWVGPPRN